MKFPSKYSNGKEVTAAQYLAEMICERLAHKNKKDLHYRFWINAEWEKEYKGQIAAANKLLSKYDIKHIIAALSTYHGRKIYSLRAPHLVDMIIRESQKKTITKKPINQDIDRSNNSVGKKYNKTNILDKLKDIDDGSITR